MVVRNMDKIISLMITAVMTVTSCSFKGENPLDGKRIAFIGDSISYGTNWQGGYGKLIGEQYNMNVTNVSKGGATLADNVHWSENSDGYRPYITDMLDNLDGDYEYIIAEGGLNDFWGHSELGEITDGFSGDFDENTMTGGMEKMFFEIRNDFPNSKVGFVITHDPFTYDAEDENGKLIDGDQIMAACAKFMRDNGTLKQNTLVATVMSNLGLFMAGEKIGINIPRTKVGDRYVLEEMLAKGYNIGGEQSGHIIFLDHNTTGDGLVSALQFLSVLKKTGMKASEAASIVTVMPQVLRNAVVKLENKNSYMENEEIAAACKALEDEFAGEGRVLIRPSGTEPLVRVMIEGKDEEYITKKAEELAELIEKILG